MPKGQKHSEQVVNEAVKQYKSLGGDTAAARTVATDFGVNYKTVLKWANGQKKAKPKRKTASKTRKAKKTVSPDKQWEGLFNDYIESRNAAQEAFKQAEAARKRIEDFVKELK